MLKILLVCAVSATGASILGCKGETPQSNIEGRPLESSEYQKSPDVGSRDPTVPTLESHPHGIRGYDRYIDEDGKNVFGDKYFYEAKSFNEGFAVVQDRGQILHYYINRNGINAFSGKQFYSADSFEGGLAVVHEYFIDEGSSSYRSGMTYYINKSGENAFGKKQFHEAGAFSEGFAAVQESASGGKEFHRADLATAQENKKWYYINKNGEKAFGDKQFDQAGAFSEGLAVVNTKTEGWYYINKNGEKAFTDKYFSSAEPFKGGFANVVEGIRPYVIDKNGNQVKRSALPAPTPAPATPDKTEIQVLE